MRTLRATSWQILFIPSVISLFGAFAESAYADGRASIIKRDSSGASERKSSTGSLAQAFREVTWRRTLENIARHNLIRNGDFETSKSEAPPSDYLTVLRPAAHDLADWDVLGVSVDWIGPTLWKAPRGHRCLDIDAPGGIRQTIRTRPGQAYRLRFQMADNEGGPPVVKTLQVAIDDRTYEFTTDPSGRKQEGPRWVTRSLCFVATCDETSISFCNASPTATAYGIALDNVVVTRCSNDAHWSISGPVACGVGPHSLHRSIPSDDDWREITRVLVAKAKQGDVAAAELLFRYSAFTQSRTPFTSCGCSDVRPRDSR